MILTNFHICFIIITESLNLLLCDMVNMDHLFPSLKPTRMDSDEQRYDEVNFYKTDELLQPTPTYINRPQITIGIEKRETRGSGLKKHVSFYIRGEDRKGEVGVWRRFNQFHQMRVAMVKVWPGCLIPSLPSKNPLLKNQQEMTRKRERYLDDFLKKMAQRQYLYYSDEFQTFLRSETLNVSEMFQKWPVPTPIAIINRYKNTFSVLNGKQISTKTISEIFAFSKMLQGNQERLIAYRKLAKDLALQRDRYNLYYRSFFKAIKSYEENIMPEYLSPGTCLLYSNNKENTPQLSDHISVAEDITQRNPYWLLYDLIKNEQRDGRAFVELLYSIEYYGDKARDYQDRIESNVRGIGQAAAGKKNIKSLIMKGTHEEIKYQLQVENQELKKDKEQSQLLRDIVTAIVAFVEIEQYKAQKREFYLVTLGKLSKLEENFTEAGNVVWNQVLLGLEKITNVYNSS